MLLVKCLDPERRDIYAFRQIPLGIAYLASTLKDSCNLEVFDMLVDENLLEKIQLEKPDIIGLSVFSVDFIFVEQLIKAIKEVSSSSLIIAGGAHATVAPAQVLVAGADIVIRGEGENAFLAIVDSFSQGMMVLEEIPGISYLEKGIRHNQCLYVEDIDELPMPGIEFFDWEKYDQYPILTSRGCPFGCKFCASKTIWGQRVRFHSANRVLIEIDKAVNSYGLKNIVFIDDTFTLNHERLIEICDHLIEKEYNITWSVNSRVDTINEKVACKMSEAGCRVVSFGVETGSDKIQDSTGKKLKREQIVAAVNACKKAGIRVKTGWMVGLPGNYEEQMKSLDLMLEIDPDEISIHHFVPMPGTAYWDFPEKYGISFDERTLLKNFSIDALPDQLGLKFDYISNSEIENAIQEIVKKLQEVGYKRPGEIDSYGLTSKVVNTYMDRGRLPVLPSKK